jgi:hypothetical protein
MRIRVRWLLGTAMVAAVTCAGVVVAAQGTTPLPVLVEQILTAVGAMQADVDGLEASVDQVQVSVDALGAPAQSQSRATAAAFFRSGVVDCVQTNVSAEPRSVRIELVNAASGVVVISDGGQVPTPPWRSRSVGAFSSAFTGTALCRFTVLDASGTRADIRAHLTIGASSANDTTLLSVLAE